MTLVLVLLMLSPLFTVTNQVTLPRTQNIDSENMNTVSETDLGRVDWVTNVAPNSDFETWNSPQNPDNVYTTRTVEESTWIETTIVSEGTKSLGMEGKALDTSNYAEVRLTQQAWVYWDNPVNTTLDLDWYMDEIGNPNNVDYFRIQIRMSSSNMYYYLGCDTGFVNGSTGYFIIDGPTNTWNHLHRNITSDYIDIFSEMPTRFDLVYIWIRAYTNEYTRVFLDDINLVNGTDVKVGGSTLNGDFEGLGGWTYQSSYDPADISQSSTAYAGDWSMNMTAISYGSLARARAEEGLNKRLSEINKGQLSFYWRIDDWVNASLNTVASVRVSVANTSHSWSMYYYLCVGGAGTLPMIIFGSDMKFEVDNFNVTDQWNFFNQNIWDDVHTLVTTDEMYIERITLEVRSSTVDSRLSVLFDEFDFTASILNDMGYETQGDLGTPIEGWTEPTGPDTYTVTDFAYTGTKAGNMTVEDDQDFYYDQSFGDLEIDETTELILDFNVYLDTFNETVEDFLYFAFNFGDGEGIAYVIANATDTYEDWLDEGTNIIFLQDTIVTGEWMNFQLDLVHDYESAVGSLPDTTVVEKYLVGLASKSSKLVAYFDDLYIYYDTAPEITNVSHSPVSPLDGDFALITATVVDATIDTVSLDYRVDNGSWSVLTMNRISSTTFQANLTDLIGGSVVEYSVTAVDAFDKSVEALNGTEYYSFTVGIVSTTTPTGDPGALIGAILIAVIILAVGVVILVYMFVIKKK